MSIVRVDRASDIFPSSPDNVFVSVDRNTVSQLIRDAFQETPKFVSSVDRIRFTTTQGTFTFEASEFRP